MTTDAEFLNVRSTDIPKVPPVGMRSAEVSTRSASDLHKADNLGLHLSKSTSLTFWTK